MADLFANHTPPPRVGYGNAKFLCDLVEGITDEEMRRRFKRGEYPDLHIASVKGWRRLAGRNDTKAEAT